jgi:hypothetical protein
VFSCGYVRPKLNRWQKWALHHNDVVNVSNALRKSLAEIYNSFSPCFLFPDLSRLP